MHHQPPPTGAVSHQQQQPLWLPSLSAYNTVAKHGHFPYTYPAPQQQQPPSKAAPSSAPCAGCQSQCCEPTCSESLSEGLTAQCTEQCVVITCDDPAHDVSDCDVALSSPPLREGGEGEGNPEGGEREVCESVSDKCTHCDGLDAAFFPCCEGYYVDGYATNHLHQRQRNENGDVFQSGWAPNSSLMEALCSCNGSIYPESGTNYAQTPSMFSSSLSTPMFSVLDPVDNMHRQQDHDDDANPRYSPALTAHSVTSPALTSASFASYLQMSSVPLDSCLAQNVNAPSETVSNAMSVDQFTGGGGGGGVHNAEHKIHTNPQAHSGSSSMADAVDPNMFTCLWRNCQAQLASVAELLGHVNVQHLQAPTSSADGDSGDAHGMQPQLVDESQLRCLWGNCGQNLSTEMVSYSSSDRNRANDVTTEGVTSLDSIWEGLTNHLLQDHLGVGGIDLESLGLGIGGDGSSHPVFGAMEYSSSQTSSSTSRDTESGAATLASPKLEGGGNPMQFTPDGGSLPDGGDQQSQQSYLLQSSASASGPSSSLSMTPSVTATTTAVNSPISSLEEEITSGELCDVKKEHICGWQDCGMVFQSCQELTLHLNMAHVGSGKSKYDCLWDGCTRNGDKGFSSKQKICRHLQTHTGYRPYQCDNCGLFFSEAATLQQHLRRHTQEKPFKCDFPDCGKRFAIAGALTIHKRTHNNDRPFICEYCGRGFAESSNLTKHIRTHTGIRPYVCQEPGCNKAFARPDQLNRHKLTHIKEKSSEGHNKIPPLRKELSLRQDKRHRRDYVTKMLL